MIAAHCRFLFNSMAIALQLAAASLYAAESRAMRNAADYLRAERPACGIQEALDSLPPEEAHFIRPAAGSDWPSRGDFVLREVTCSRDAVRRSRCGTGTAAAVPDASPCSTASWAKRPR